MSDDARRPAAVAGAYTDAVNRRAYAEAAGLLAPDVELIFPGGRQVGREAWLESRTRPQPDDLTEEVLPDDITEGNSGAELTGRLVQRWTESGDAASEMPVRIEFTVVAGEITRLELIPLPGS